MFFIKVIFSFSLSFVLAVFVFKVNQELKTQKNKKDKTYKKTILSNFCSISCCFVIFYQWNDFDLFPF